MSRIAKNPVPLPKGVEIALAENEITVKGPLGALKQRVNPSVRVEQEGDNVVCKAVEGTVDGGAQSGTMRALLANMVTGVTKGFERKLSLVGVGYRAQAQGNKLLELKGTFEIIENNVYKLFVSPILQDDQPQINLFNKSTHLEEHFTKYQINPLVSDNSNNSGVIQYFEKFGLGKNV